jgi:hypothetical protein
VENGHTVPSVETIEKLARALEIPVYQVFYDGVGPAEAPPIKLNGTRNNWGTKGADALYVGKLTRLLSKMDKRDRNLLMLVASKVSTRKPHD